MQLGVNIQLARDFLSFLRSMGIFSKKQNTERFITIVSGLPRSGTSMMMRMLEAGGMEVVVDNIRKAGEDNPNGYYEFEQVKKIKEGHAWIDQTYGKAFKMVSMLLKDLPQDKKYKIIFMQRNMEEVLRSQKLMLQRKETRESLSESDDKEMREIFANHIDTMKKWLRKQDHMDVAYVNYNNFIEKTRHNAEAINKFLGGRLDVENMVGVVDPTLYRHRASR